MPEVKASFCQELRLGYGMGVMPESEQSEHRVQLMGSCLPQTTSHDGLRYQ